MVVGGTVVEDGRAAASVVLGGAVEVTVGEAAFGAVAGIAWPANANAAIPRRSPATTTTTNREGEGTGEG